MAAAVIADELRAAVTDMVPRLRAISDAQATASRGPGKWQRVEILGHLIDSAANNQQRFVLAPRGATFEGPTYEQEHWVRVHAYRMRPWSEIIDLWAAFNLHLAHAMAAVPDDRLSTPCTIGTSSPETLEWLLQDYIRHMHHHLAQILEDTALP